MKTFFDEKMLRLSGLVLCVCSILSAQAASSDSVRRRRVLDDIPLPCPPSLATQVVSNLMKEDLWIMKDGSSLVATDSSKSVAPRHQDVSFI